MAVLNPDLYTVAIIAPLPIEARAVYLLLDKTHPGAFPMTRGYRYVFIAGEMSGHNVIIATLPLGQEYGTASISQMVGQMVSFFPYLQFGLLVGIAAGLPTSSRDIRLGDVIVATPEGNTPGVVPYELGKETKDGFQPLRFGYLLPKTAHIVSSAIDRIRSSKDETSVFLPYYQSIKSKPHPTGTFRDPGQDLDKIYEPGTRGQIRLINRPPRPNSQRTRVWYGPIGSGDKLIKSTQKRNELRNRYGIIGLEMEAAGTMGMIPAGVIRGVCDYGDERKDKKWQAYAAAMAASYAKAVVAQVPPRRRS